MPGLLTTDHSHKEDAVPPEVAHEIWRMAAVLRIAKVAKQIMWHRLCFRIQVKSTITIPTTGFEILPCTFWVHLDETGGHDRMLDNAKPGQVDELDPDSAASSSSDCSSKQSEEQGSSIVHRPPILRPILASPMLQEPGIAEPTLYVFRSRYDLEQMLMAASDRPTHGETNDRHTGASTVDSATKNDNSEVASSQAK